MYIPARLHLKYKEKIVKLNVSTMAMIELFVAYLWPIRHEGR